MIRAVFFDVDDTLFDDRRQMVRCIRATAERAAQQTGASSESLASAYQEIADRFWYEEFSLAPPPPLEEIRLRLWRRALTTVGTHPSDELVAQLAALYGELRTEPAPALPGTIETLTELHRRGYVLGALTNGFSSTHVPKLDALGATEFLSGIFTPDRLGVSKPDPQAFLKSCAALGVGPGESVHVGDSLVTDVGGAKGAGLSAVWFNRSGRLLPPDAAVPDRTIADLTELLVYLS